MKKTLITLLALGGVAIGANPPVKYFVQGNGPLTLTDASCTGDNKTLDGGITIAVKLNVNTLKSYLTGATTPTSDIISVLCDRSGNNSDVRLGIKTYTTTADNVTTSGLAGTWDNGGTYTFNMGAGTLNSESSDFWNNVTGASVVFISKLSDGVQQGSGSTENKGTTAILTLQKNINGVASYEYFGGQWYDGLYSATIIGVTSVSFDSAVLGANVYYQGVTVANGKELGKAAISIPEPTTATLSLLALAGLAARRRRQ